MTGRNGSKQQRWRRLASDDRQVDLRLVSNRRTFPRSQPWCLNGWVFALLGLLLLALPTAAQTVDQPSFIIDQENQITGNQLALLQKSCEALLQRNLICLICTATGDPLQSPEFIKALTAWNRWLKENQLQGQVSLAIIGFDAQKQEATLTLDGPKWKNVDILREQILKEQIQPRIDAGLILEGLMAGVANINLAFLDRQMMPRYTPTKSKPEPDTKAPFNPFAKLVPPKTPEGSTTPGITTEASSTASDPDGLNELGVAEAVDTNQMARYIFFGIIGASMLFLGFLAFLSKTGTAPLDDEPQSAIDTAPVDILGGMEEPTEGDRRSFETMLVSQTAKAALNKMWQHAKMRDFVGQLTMRCPLSPILINLMSELETGNYLTVHLAEIINRDQQLAADLLHLVNDGPFQLPQYVTGVEQVVNLLPRESLRAIILFLHFRKQFGVAESDWFSVEELQQHAQLVSRLAQFVCSEESQLQAVTDSLAAGMLHEVGRMILASMRADEMQIIAARSLNELIDRYDLERETFGFSYVEVSTYALGLLKLPEPVLVAVAYHRQPSEYPREEEVFPLTAIHGGKVLVQEYFPDQAEGQPLPVDLEYLSRVRRINRVTLWRERSGRIIQKAAVSGQRQLSVNDQAQIDSWTEEFEHNWDENRLPSRLAGLPPKGSPLRLPTIIALVRSDLRRRWQIGLRSKLEEYFELIPDLGGKDGVPAELVFAEYQIRKERGSSVTPEELCQRFPRQAKRLRQLIDGSSAPPSPRTANTFQDDVTQIPAFAGGSGPGRLSGSVRGVPRRGSQGWQETSNRRASSADSLTEMQDFGRYRIVRPLGQGGMGAVYLATDKQLDRQVALKIPHFGPDGDQEVVERFYREARAAAKFRHPNLCPVYDVGEIDGMLYLTMPYINGKPLSHFANPDNLLDHQELTELMRKIAIALAEAHREGVIHRDLKPSNVIVNVQGEPVIMDFGLAQRLDISEVRLTQQQEAVGTPAYMAPEQVRGERDAIGPHTDIYSLGVILFELLTGRLPFEEESAAALYILIATEEPPRPSRFCPGLNPKLEKVCLKAMAKKIRDRFATMQAFADALPLF